MIVQIKPHINWYTHNCPIRENHMNKNEMICSFVCGPLENISGENSHYIIRKNQIQKRKINGYQKQSQNKIPMDNHNENQEFSYINFRGKNAHVAAQSKIIGKQLNKENFLKIYNHENEGGCGNGNDDNNKTNCFSNVHGEGDSNDYIVQQQAKRNNKCLKENQKNLSPQQHKRVDSRNQYNQSLYSSYNNQYPLQINNHAKSSDNIDREEVQNIVSEGDGDIEGSEEDDNNCEARTTVADDDLVNNYTQNKCKTNGEPRKETSKEDNVTLPKGTTTPLKPLATFVETQAIDISHVQNITQNLHQQHFVNDLEKQILHGQQLNVHNLLDVAGSLCAGPMGALCDMAVFSKLDCSPIGDLKDHTPSNQDFLAKKYYHPLYAHGVCRWPGCELSLDDMATFVKHLKTEHCLDDRSTAQARVQMQVVSQLEMHLQKERDRLQAMMHHLYLTKHFVMPEDAQENISHIRYKNAIRSVSSTPDQIKSNINSNDDSDGASDLQSLLINSGCATRKRICDKSPLALAGGLPYMLERAGLDVQQEIQRNREFYKNADVRPPFTYASLIRQSIIESPDKQLTLNEIYNWFQNTFCYFRRNAATWKNAIRTNLSLHKCFVRYEDDFGSFWMVDDSEFVKRRHLSRGRPRKYEPSSSPNPNSQQFGSTIASTASNDVVDGGSGVNDTIAVTNPDSSTASPLSRQRCASNASNPYHTSGNKNNGRENNGGNDDYDICEVSQRSPAGCQTHIHSGRKQCCGSKQRPRLQGSLIGIAIKTNINSLIDHNRLSSRMHGGGVIATANNPGIGGIGDIGPVGSLDVDNQNGSIINDNTCAEIEDPSDCDFHTQSISNDGVLNSPTGSNGRYSPNLQNTWSFGSSLSDEAASEFACINNDRYRNFVTGLHLQTLTQRHHFQQHKSSSHRMYSKSHQQQQQQQNTLRNNISSQQHDVRSLHQNPDYHIYHTSQDDQHQKLLLDQQNQPMGQDIFGVNAILSNTDKYFSHNIERHTDGEVFRHESFNPRQQQHISIRHHTDNSGTDLSTDETTNHMYIHHRSGYELDVKYTPPFTNLCSFKTQNLNRADVNQNKRSANNIYTSKTLDTEKEESSIVDCDQEEIQHKRKKSHISSTVYEDVEIKAETDSESELKNNINMPLRTKSC